LIIIAVFVLIGVIFGTILSFMVMGKIIKRHMNLLERQATARCSVVADLRNPAQVAEADRQLSEGRLNDVVAPRTDDPRQLLVNHDPNAKPKGKQFDDHEYYPTK